MDRCSKQVPGTDLRCGQNHGIYCSDECAEIVGRGELAELGITPEMMKEALDGYYECKDLITRRALSQPATPPQSPYETGLA
jgi:hypothetical protein